MLSRISPVLALSALACVANASASSLSAVARNLGVREAAVNVTATATTFDEVEKLAKPVHSAGGYAAQYEAFRAAAAQGGDVVRFIYHGGAYAEGYAVVRDDAVVARMVTIRN